MTEEQSMVEKISARLVRFALWLLRRETLLPEEQLARELARRTHGSGAFRLRVNVSVNGAPWLVTTQEGTSIDAALQEPDR